MGTSPDCIANNDEDKQLNWTAVSLSIHTAEKLHNKISVNLDKVGYGSPAGPTQTFI